MDVGGDAQALAAAGNHAALNLANALGAFLGGAVIAAGYGYTAPAVVGAALALAGLGVLTVSYVLEQRTRPAQPGPGAGGEEPAASAASKKPISRSIARR